MADGPTVLVIDDDVLVRRAFSRCLEQIGFAVDQAENGEAAVRLIRQEEPELVLCDLRMPGMDGLEVLEIIGEEWPDLPVIVMSGQGTVKDAVEALKRGARDYLIKPVYDPTILEQSVRRVLETAELERQNRQYRAHLEDLNRRLSEALRVLRADQEAGRNVQFQLLPLDGLCIGPYRFQRRLLPSRLLSGDFVDYFALGDDRVGLYIADVSGHGSASAFVTAMLVTLISKYREAFVRGENDLVLRPDTLLEALNSDILALSLDKHVTMFYAVLQEEPHRLIFSNAGHYPYPILRNADRVEVLERPGRPLGLFEGTRYQLHTIDLADNVDLLAVSDGVLELSPGQPVSEWRSLLCRLVGLGVSIDSVVSGLKIAEDQDLPDDITLLLVQRRNGDG